MKNRMMAMLLLSICLVGSSEKAKVVPVAVQHAAEAQVVSINYEKLDQVLKDENGIPMLQVEGNSPVVTIEGNKKAAQRINKFYENKRRAFEKQQAITFKQAKEDYNRRSKEEKSYWGGYALGMQYTPERLDEKVISLVENRYEYTGGAHPNSLRYAQNFDVSTGGKLTLKDITTDEKAAISLINNEILKQTKQDQYKDYFFPGYEKNIKDILTEDTWYLASDGFVVISNEYIISPHAVGILEFKIPYEAFPYLKPEYMPPKSK